MKCSVEFNLKYTERIYSLVSILKGFLEGSAAREEHTTRTYFKPIACSMLYKEVGFWESILGAATGCRVQEVVPNPDN